MRRWWRRRQRRQLVIPVPIIGARPKTAPHPATVQEPVDTEFIFGVIRPDEEVRYTQPPMYMYTPTVPRRDRMSVPITYDPVAARTKLLSYISNGQEKSIKRFEIECAPRKENYVTR